MKKSNTEIIITKMIDSDNTGIFAEFKEREDGEFTSIRTDFHYRDILELVPFVILEPKILYAGAIGEMIENIRGALMTKFSLIYWQWVNGEFEKDENGDPINLPPEFSEGLLKAIVGVAGFKREDL